MEIDIIAFGIAKDILGTRKCRLALNDPALVSTLRERLLDKYDGFDELASLRFAVNEEYVHDDYLLNPGDEVVLIPPVSGG